MSVQDGYVHVSLRQVSESGEEPGMVELCVSDTGKVLISRQSEVRSMLTSCDRGLAKIS